MPYPLRSAVLVACTSVLVTACGGGASSGGGESSAPGSSPGKDAAATADGGTPADAGPGADVASPPADGGAPDAVTTTPSPPSSGTIGFHLLLGVPGSDTPGDSLKLDGDGYTDLIMSNIVAGVMYGHLVQSCSPGMLFDPDYLYGSLFGQLLQENLATELYVAGSGLIDSSPDQQAVMGAGQGGPYQINNYAADMVYGSYAPKGYSLIDYVALQKNIGYPFATAADQYTQPTPTPFNDVLYGPMLTAYFHFNDYVALHEIGPVGGYTPAWEPDYDEALTSFQKLPGNFLEVLLNTAYNQGYYGPLVSSYSKLGATATAQTVAGVDGYASVWGVNDTYQQYPYQVRYYLDQLYDNPVPTTSPTVTTTPDNHVRFGMAALGATFAGVFGKLAYVDAAAGYVTIPQAKASAAFATALSGAGVAPDAALDLSQTGDRATIFAVIERAIAALEKTLGTDFTARTASAL